MGLWGVLKFFLYRALEVSLVLTVLVFIPNIPPYASFNKPYKIIPPKLEGKISVNEKLNVAEIWHKGDFLGPEAFAEYKGELYTSVHSGDIIKLTGNHITPIIKFGKPCKGFFEERICGRPLGLSFDSKGYLYAADAYYGIFKVNVLTGDKNRIISLDEEIDGKKPKLTNSLAIASNGDIYWTDSSTNFYLQDGLFEWLSDGSGRLIHYNAKTGRNTVLIKDMIFSNGVALSEDEDFVIVAETGRNRILRYYLKGPKKGQQDVFIDQLPGLTDNINSDGQGGYLIPIVVPVDADNPNFVQIVGPFPLLRKLLARLMMLPEVGFEFVNRMYPNEFCQRAVHFIGHFTSVSMLQSSKRVTVLHVSKTGEILDSVHSINGKLSSISEAFIFKDKLYLGSPFNDYIARVPLENIGWAHLKKQDRAAPITAKPTTRTEKVTTQKPTTTTTTPKPTTQRASTTTAKPTTTTTPKPVPTTTTTAKPAPTATTTPKPAATTTTTPKPAPTTTTTPKPAATTTTTPKPAPTTTTKPVTKATIKSTTTATPKSTTPTTPKPADTTTPKPDVTTTPRPVTSTTPKPSVGAPKPATIVTPKATTTRKPVSTATSTEAPRTTTSNPTATNKPSTEKHSKDAAKEYANKN